MIRKLHESNAAAFGFEVVGKLTSEDVLALSGELDSAIAVHKKPIGLLADLTRMDGAAIGAIDSSIAKARTAVHFAASTSDLSAAAAGGPLATIATSSEVRLAFVAGGIPILDSEGVVIGGLGAGGGSPSQDHAAVSSAARSVGGRL